VRALEETGVIARRVTLLDAAKLGPSLSVFIQVTLEKQIEEMLESFEQSIKRFPEVMECYRMTGGWLFATPSNSSISSSNGRRKRAASPTSDRALLEAGQIQDGASRERSGWIAVRLSLAPFISSGVTSKRSLHGNYH
jgi:hypothetical protein